MMRKFCLLAFYSITAFIYMVYVIVSIVTINANRMFILFQSENIYVK